jgi:hypothetical protein
MVCQRTRRENQSINQSILYANGLFVREREDPAALSNERKVEKKRDARLRNLTSFSNQVEEEQIQGLWRRRTVP